MSSTVQFALHEAENCFTSATFGESTADSIRRQQATGNMSHSLVDACKVRPPHILCIGLKCRKTQRCVAEGKLCLSWSHVVQCICVHSDMVLYPTKDYPVHTHRNKGMLASRMHIPSALCAYCAWAHTNLLPAMGAWPSGNNCSPDSASWTV